jgi:hypothetical protein
MIVVSIVFQNRPHPLYLVAENRDNFWRLNFIQKLGDYLQQLFWLVEGLADERSLHISEKPEVQ